MTGVQTCALPIYLIAGGASGAAGRLGVGTADQVLSVVAGAPAWASPAATDSLLTNGGMEVWQRGTSFAASGAYTADDWKLGLGAGSSGTLTRESSIVDTGSKYSLKIVYTHTSSSFLRQAVEDFSQLRSRSVTFSCRYNATANNAFRVLISDGVAATYSGYGTGDSTWRTLTLTKAMSVSATACTIELTLDASVTLYVDNATLVVGSAALAYAPLHPADELSRCLRYYEVHGGGLAMGPIIQGYGAAGASAGYGVVFATRKAITPTMTKNGTWTANNCGQPALNFPTFASYEFATNITALGTIGCWASDATCTVVAEANV